MLEGKKSSSSMIERCSSLGRVMRGDGEGIVEFCGGVVHVDIEGGNGSHALLTLNTSQPRSHHPSFLNQSLTSAVSIWVSNSVMSSSSGRTYGGSTAGPKLAAACSPKTAFIKVCWNWMRTSLDIVHNHRVSGGSPSK